MQAAETTQAKGGVLAGTSVPRRHFGSIKHVLSANVAVDVCNTCG